MIPSGDDTCTVADWKGKMIGPWKGLDGKVHPPTNKRFALEFCTVARWRNGEIVEERLFYDQVGFLRQIGVLYISE
ncbi:MAG TPA: ester cyclase [Myxococcales bacterium]